MPKAQPGVEAVYAHCKHLWLLWMRPNTSLFEKSWTLPLKTVPHLNKNCSISYWKNPPALKILGSLRPLTTLSIRGTHRPSRSSTVTFSHCCAKSLPDRNMLQGGVIQENHSPWVATVLLVHKKDGSLRFCVDYHKPNSCTHRDAYPLPWGQVKFFFTLNLYSGYWLVPVWDQDRFHYASGTVHIQSHVLQPQQRPKHLPAPNEEMS